METIDTPKWSHWIINSRAKGTRVFVQKYTAFSIKIYLSWIVKNKDLFISRYLFLTTLLWGISPHPKEMLSTAPFWLNGYLLRQPSFILFDWEDFCRLIQLQKLQKKKMQWRCKSPNKTFVWPNENCGVKQIDFKETFFAAPEHTFHRSLSFCFRH